MVFSFTRKQQEDLFDTDVNAESCFRERVAQHLLQSIWRVVTQQANEPRTNQTFFPFPLSVPSWTNSLLH